MFGFGITFEDLYSREGLVKLDAAFIMQLAEHNTVLHNRLVSARATPEALSPKDESQLLIDLSTPLEDFISELFGIQQQLGALKSSMHALAPLLSCKRLFVQRKAAKSFKPEEAIGFDAANLLAKMGLANTDDIRALEMRYAEVVTQWQSDAASHTETLNAAMQYAAWALYSPEGKHKHARGILFKQPGKLDPMQLVPLATEQRHGVTMLKTMHAERQRQGFALTDSGCSLGQSLDEANYCIFCHNQGKDSCARGLKEPSGNFKQNTLGNQLAGCPLEEKISEMNFLRSEGIPLGALAMITVDNPMCAGTGHRICNDCMKSCIYQKQDPVNIPQSETRTLRDVLALPYGFEIYSLLTRWNPLNIRRPLPKPPTGRRVLVAGMGPAGYTLAHHLMNDGHIVVGIDGLKIEPLPPALCGVSADGKPVPFEPVRDASTLFEDLGRRIGGGFGGVAEYGITVRWDKNFLKLLRLLLERRRQFALFGGVRFGSTLRIEDAWALGFDHIALCMGAGKPTVLDIPNGLARGVRTASDFLMALQLTGAGRSDSIANLQLRLPVVVVGGGLTAIDTSTEALAYYPVQVEKFLSRYETLVRELGEQAVRAKWNAEEYSIADEFIAHAKTLRLERGKQDGNVVKLLQSWGGVTMAYRKKLTDAPSYRLNHEEVEKALEEGIFIAEGLEPTEVKVDRWEHAEKIIFKASGDAETFILPARTLLVAAGTSPNTMLAQEDPTHLHLHGKYFQALDEQGMPVSPEKSAKPGQVRVLTSTQKDGRSISFFGDMHPSFAGNVVKAMGSAKQGYPVVSQLLARRTDSHSQSDEQFFDTLRHELRASVHEVHRLTPTIVEVVVKAPMAAKRFEPGQFYRLQNFEANALATRHPSLATTLAMEGLALTGASVDKAKGLLSTIVLEMGGSSDLCAQLKPGEPIILMGPTGEATHIPQNKTVLLAGGGLGNAVLFSIGQACRQQGSRVLYFAAYKKAADRYKIEEIEKAADKVIWCCEAGDDLPPTRTQDAFFRGNVVQAMLAYGEGKLGAQEIPLGAVDHIIAIGSDRMMEAVGKARHGVLKAYLKPAHEAIGSINSPMQCMMKEICAQCLQQHIDPTSGKVSYVYSCKNQDQKLDEVSFPFLAERLKQNSVQEKLSALWIDHCLKQQGMRKAG